MSLLRHSLIALFLLQLAGLSSETFAAEEAPSLLAPGEELNDPPQLVIDAGGFAGGDIRALAVSDGDRWLAAAGGKEIRIWNIATGELYATLRGYREPEGFNIGNINALAFSAGGKYLVVGVSDNTSLGSTRIYDMRRPEVLHKLLVGQTGCTLGTVMSPHGKYMATFGCGNRVDIERIDPDSGKVETVAAIDVDFEALATEAKVKQGGDYFGFPADEDWLMLCTRGKRTVISIAGKRVVDNPDKFPPRVYDAYLRHTSRLSPYIDGAHNARSNVDMKFVRDSVIVRGGVTQWASRKPKYWVAAWIGNVIAPKLYEKHRYTPTKVAISPTASLVASADLLGDIHVWDLKTQQTLRIFSAQQKRLFGVATSADPNQIYFADTSYTQGEYNFNHFGSVSRKFDLRARNATTAGAAELTNAAQRSPRLAMRDPNSDATLILEATPIPRVAGIEPVDQQDIVGKFLLSATVDRSGQKETDILNPFLSGELPTSYFVPLLNARRSGVTWVLVGTENGSVHQLSPFNFGSPPPAPLPHAPSDGDAAVPNDAPPSPQGISRRSFRGHTGMITGIAELPDGRTAVSSSIDGTIRFWDLSVPKVAGDVPFETSGNRVIRPPHEGDGPCYAPIPENPTPEQLEQMSNIWGAIEVDPPEFKGVQYGDLVHKFDDAPFYERKRLIAAGKYKPGQTVKLEMSRKGQPYQASINLVETAALAEPLLTIFFAADGEWIAYTPKGYYDCSPRGEGYVGWHVNRGRSASASFNRVGQYRKKSYRPDLVAMALMPAPVPDPEEIASNPSLAAPPAPTDLSVRENLDRLQPPEVRMVSPDLGVSTQAKEIPIVLEVDSAPGLKEQKVAVRVNGRPVAEPVTFVAGDERGPARYTTTATLQPGQNVITAVATNRESSSDAVIRTVRRGLTDIPTIRGDLHILSIGISTYKDRELDLNFAETDARKMVELFSNQRGRLYKDVHPHLLCNEDATVKGIGEAMALLATTVKPEDTAYVFITAHGLFDERNKWRLLTHDVSSISDFQSLYNTTITATAISEWFQEDIKGRCVLFLDTCHAAGSARALQVKGLDRWNGATRLNPWQGSSRHILLSCLPSQSSIELRGRSLGAFMASIEDALAQPQRSDTDHDGTLTFSELFTYLEGELPKISGGLQSPVQIPDTTVGAMKIFDFGK